MRWLSAFALVCALWPASAGAADADSDSPAMETPQATPAAEQSGTSVPEAAKVPAEKPVAPADPEPAEDPVERGQAIAEANCGRCHAVGDAGASPEPMAPPFRELHKLYPVESLAESLAEGIVTGHPDMPAFELTAPQVNALISYLKTL
ncbi:Cytochrome c [Methyloligella halotolerans]|uniref:Cytochrome c n=1 Tax=Methyloligella halotolerans TaxID=1177755 RepID=A0A1E2S1H5_9HYPH|nr:Cytochrome c [Methyloligella halotolerans]